MAIFRDDDDRRAFASIVNRYLSEVPSLDHFGRPYAQLGSEVKLCARNLLTTHYHLIFNQLAEGGMDNLMRRVINAYTQYFHRRYGTSGSLFAGPFRAKRIEGRKSFLYRVGYVHKNHKREGLDWAHSSHRQFLEPDEAPSWLNVGPVLNAFGGLEEYLEYMEEFEERARLDEKLRLDRG